MKLLEAVQMAQRQNRHDDGYFSIVFKDGFGEHDILFAPLDKSIHEIADRIGAIRANDRVTMRRYFGVGA